MGEGETNIGVDAAVGNLQSVGNVFLRERATVAGMLQTSGTFSAQNNVTILGPISENDDVLAAADVQSWSVFVADEQRAEVHLEPDESRTLAPGAYGPLRLAPRAKAYLTVGRYSFDSITLEPSSEVNISGEGVLLLDVLEAFTYWGRFLVAGASPPGLLVSYLGTSPAWIQAPFYGTLVAPEAKIDVASFGSQPHRGSFFGHEVEVHGDARIVQTPFPWEALVEANEESTGEPQADIYPTSTGTAPPLSGTPIEDHVWDFLDWFYLTVKGDLPAIAEEIAAVLISEFQRLRQEDTTRARMVLPTRRGACTQSVRTVHLRDEEKELRRRGGTHSPP